MKQKRILFLCSVLFCSRLISGPRDHNNLFVLQQFSVYCLDAVMPFSPENNVSLWTTFSLVGEMSFALISILVQQKSLKLKYDFQFSVNIFDMSHKALCGDIFNRLFKNSSYDQSPAQLWKSVLSVNCTYSLLVPQSGPGHLHKSQKLV